MSQFVRFPITESYFAWILIRTGIVTSWQAMLWSRFILAQLRLQPGKMAAAAPAPAPAQAPAPALAL